METSRPFQSSNSKTLPMRCTAPAISPTKNGHAHNRFRFFLLEKKQREGRCINKKAKKNRGISDLLSTEASVASVDRTQYLQI